MRVAYLLIYGLMAMNLSVYLCDPSRVKTYEWIVVIGFTIIGFVGSLQDWRKFMKEEKK